MEVKTQSSEIQLKVLTKLELEKELLKKYRLNWSDIYRAKILLQKNIPKYPTIDKIDYKDQNKRLSVLLKVIDNL